MDTAVPQVIAVSASPSHETVDKELRSSIVLLAGLGVEGDAHAGATVRNPWKVRRDPTEANPSQVHLLPAELLDALAVSGFVLGPGELGENVTTRELALERLPLGTLLFLGDEAVVRLTGLRDPCVRINSVRPRLLKQVLHRDDAGSLVRRAGVMAVVEAGGEVTEGTLIGAELPPGPPRILPPV
ncbi:MOSC domain-containing protein [Streptomyces sp. NPDC051555]|uniref:MOSC domain-containing protein n=1 Tax=Streptomyces sp. NPDC051555 TaxID=3365657 RepID=UPI0037B63E5B